jgi:hypothetical protein
MQFSLNAAPMGKHVTELIKESITGINDDLIGKIAAGTLDFEV